MSEKIHESIKILLQILIPFGVLLSSMFMSQQVPIQTVNRILGVTETGLFVVAFGMNIFHSVRLSLLVCEPPLCLRRSCQQLRWLLLFLAGICLVYIFLSIEWMLLYPQQQLIAVVDFLYNTIEILLALFAIIFAYFANQFKLERKGEACPNEP